jgi:serine/threonine protein phosphatase PrpC
MLPGDVYLLCSDGLNDMVENDEIALTLQALSANLELAANSWSRWRTITVGATTFR